VRRTPVPIYFCPSRRAPMVFTAGVPIALLDYAGNAGTETDTGEPGAALGNGLNGLVVRRPGGSTGPSDIRSNQVRMDSSIPDGTSNTLLVGEKRLRPDKLGTPQLHDDQGYTSGWDRDEVCWGITAPAQDKRGEDGYYQFGSAHPSGFNAVFADGSVHHVSYTIQSNNDITTGPLGMWQRLCIRDDGLP